MRCAWALKTGQPVVPQWWSREDGHTICVSTNIEGIAAMSAIAATDKLFFDRADAALDQAAAAQIIEQALSGSDDGELFLEYRESESISLDDGNIRSANFDSGMGFGLRAVAGEATGYAHSGEISE